MSEKLNAGLMPSFEQHMASVVMCGQSNSQTGHGRRQQTSLSTDGAHILITTCRYTMITCHCGEYAMSDRPGSGPDR